MRGCERRMGRGRAVLVSCADEVDEAGEFLSVQFQFEAFGHEADAGGLQFGDIAAIDGILLISAAAECECGGSFSGEDAGGCLSAVCDGNELQEVGADFAVGVKDVCEQFCGCAVSDCQQAGTHVGAQRAEFVAAAAFALEDCPALLAVGAEFQGILPGGDDF